MTVSGYQCFCKHHCASFVFFFVVGLLLLAPGNAAGVESPPNIAFFQDEVLLAGNSDNPLWRRPKFYKDNKKKIRKKVQPPPKVQPGRRPSRSAKIAPPISYTSEYSDFYGLHETPIPYASWDRLLNRRIDELVRAARSYPGVHNFLEVPGEKHRGLFETHRQVIYAIQDIFRSMQDSFNDYFPGTIGKPVSHPNREIEIFWFLGLSGDPGRQALEGPSKFPYAAVTAKTMWLLHRRILSSGGRPLEPADVMRMALDVTKGNYPLAVLTTHNLLKTITERGRFVVITAIRDRKENPRYYTLKFNEYRKDLGQYGRFVRKLASLRRDPNRVKDKMGPWYHLFAVLTASAVASPDSAMVAAYGEHLLKLLSFFDNEGGQNREKATIDVRFAYAAVYQLANLSRNYAYRDRDGRFWMSQPYRWTVHRDSASGGTVFRSPVPAGSRYPLTLTVLISREPSAAQFFNLLFDDIHQRNPSLRMVAQGNRMLGGFKAKWRKYATTGRQVYFAYTAKRFYADRHNPGYDQVILVSIGGTDEAYQVYGGWAAGLLRTLQLRNLLPKKWKGLRHP